MLSVESVLGLMGLIIITGFVGNFIFEKIRIPDVFLLLGVGMLIGQWLTPETRQVVSSFAPYFGSVALIMILFEGGLELDVTHVAKHFRRAFMLAVSCLFVTTLLVAWAAHGWLGWPLWPSLMFGCVLGCVSSAIVIPTVQRSRASHEVKALVTMEAVLSDTLAIVVLVGLMDLALGLRLSPGRPLAKLISDIMIAIGVALPVGFMWLNILEWTKGRQLSYLWTFAVLVLTYAGVNAMHGSGPIAVFFVALLIGNSRHLPTWLLWGKLFVSEEEIDKMAHETVHWFHTELTFLIRSFFFVYIGLLFEVRYMQGRFFWVMLGFTGLIAAARWVCIRFIQPAPKPLPRTLLWAYMPRGLVSVVLATLPMQKNVAFSHEFTAFTIPVIITTNLLMTIWVFGWDMRHPKPRNEEQPDEVPSGV